MSYQTKENYHVPQFWFEAEYAKARTILDSSPLPDAKHLIYDHITDSLKGTHNEFFLNLDGQRSPVLPFKLEIRDQRLYGFGDWYTDAIKTEEHHGQTKATCQKIEQFLISAPEGKLAFFVSPSGPSGMEDEHGQPVIYKDTAIYFFQRTSTTQVQCWNVFTDLSLLESERLLQSYGIKSDTTKDLPDRMEHVIASPVFPSSGISGVLHDVQTLLNTPYIKGTQTFEYTQWLVDNPDIVEQSWSTSEQIKSLLSQFEQLIQAAPDNILLMSTLQRELPTLLLKISAVARGKDAAKADLSHEASYISSLDGCTSSGSGLENISGYRETYIDGDSYVMSGGVYHYEVVIKTPWGYKRCRPQPVLRCPHTGCNKAYYGQTLPVGFRCDCRQIFWGIC